MRSISLVPLLLALVAPPLALGTPATGFPALPDCTNTTNRIDSDAAELYVLKIPSSTSSRGNDWLWNVDRKTEAPSDNQAFLDSSGFWSTGDVWAVPQTPSDVAFVFVTFAGGGLYVDSNDGSSVDWGVAPVQQVGNSLPRGRDQGIDLVLPETAGTYQVELSPGNIRTFPMATTSGGLNYAFSPIAEVNNLDAVPGACQIGGAMMNPRDPTRGAIIGYNVYRVPACTCTPTRDDFHRAILTDDDADGGWIYFIDLRTFDVTMPDGGPVSNDLRPDDLVGIQNVDGRMYSGNEVLIFSDMNNITRPRNGELAPVRGLGYWYRLQPVIAGRISDFGSTGFTVNDVFPGDHRMDLDGDGEFDAVSLNSVAPFHDTAEFYSPQAEPGNGGDDGLGLTHRGMPLLGDCVWVEPFPLPATGQVELTGRAGATDVELTLSTGLEPGDVIGYNVFRHMGAHRVRVNEKPILAQGGESNVYALIDAGVRLRGARSLEYIVETLHAGGAPSTFSEPFVVSAATPPGRRNR